MVAELTGGSNAVLRRMNLRLVLGAVREHGPLSRSDLRRQTGLSRPTLDEVLAQLLAMQLLAERPATDEEMASRRPGPRPRYLAFNADRGRLIGVDIGAEKVIVIATDLDGRAVGTFRSHVSGMDREVLLSEVRKLMAEAATICQEGGKAVRAVVVGTPGVIDRSTGSVSLAPQIPGWEGVVLERELLRDYDCPSTVENEMHLAVLGERWLGAAKGCDNVVYIGLGIGVSAGVIVDGTLLRGAFGRAGEIGYLDFGPPDGAAGIGSSGRFERAVGATAFMAEVPGARENSPEEVFRSAAAGDVSAQLVIDRAAATLAQGVAALALALDPALIVLGGGLSATGEALRSPVSQRLKRLLPVTPPLLKVSTLGERATVFGAIHRARELCNELIYEELLSGRLS